MYLQSDLLFEVGSYLVSIQPGATIFTTWLLHPLWRRGVLWYRATPDDTDDTLKDYPNLISLWCDRNTTLTDDAFKNCPKLRYMVIIQQRTRFDSIY
jgi:hypothetical protein